MLHHLQQALYTIGYPAYNITGANTSSPYVYPKQTTTYNLTVSYKGCIANDSVTVNVIDKVTLALPA